MTAYIVEYTLRGACGRTHHGRSVHDYNERDAEALAAIWNGEKDNGVPIIRCEVVGLEVMEQIAREVSKK